MKKLMTATLLTSVLAAGCDGKVQGTFDEAVRQTSDRIEALLGTYEASIEISSSYMEAAANKWSQRPVGGCEMADNELTDFLGGAMAGSAFTGWIAGDSIIAVITSAGSFAVAIPAVATGIVVGATTATAAYAGVKTWCAGA